MASLPAAHVGRERKEALGYRAPKPGRDGLQGCRERPPPLQSRGARAPRSEATGRVGEGARSPSGEVPD